MVSRRKGHSETWAPFSPHVSNKPPSQTPSPLILENAPREIHSHPWGRPEGSPEKEEAEDEGEGKLAKGNPRREGSPRPSTSSSLHHYHHPLLVLGVSPRRLFRRSRVRDGDLRNHAFVRFVPLARAGSIGVFRHAQRSPQASASELGKEDASHRRVLLRGEVSWGNPAWLSSLSPLTFATFNVANDARLSSLIFRVALHRDNHFWRSGERLIRLPNSGLMV